MVDFTEIEKIINAKVAERQVNGLFEARPAQGFYYRFIDDNGKVTEGKIVSIARVRTGAVLAFFANGKAKPVSKHGKWYEAVNPETGMTRTDEFLAIEKLKGQIQL